MSSFGFTTSQRVIRPEDHGVIANNRGAADGNRESFEVACREWLDHGGTLALATGATYYIAGGVRAKSVSDIRMKHCFLEGNGASLVFTTDGDFYSFLIGPDSSHLWNEHGYLIIKNLSLVHDAFENMANQASQSYGLSVQNCRNVRVDVNDVISTGFRVNFHFQRNWPLSMHNCKSTKGKHALWIDTGMTTATYDGCEFIESRYGVTMWTNGPAGIFNQTFRSCRFEDLECLGILNAASGEAVRNAVFLDPYAESWGRPFVLALQPPDDKSPLDVDWFDSLGEGGGAVKDTAFVRGYWNNEKYEDQFPDTWEDKFRTGPRASGTRAEP